MSDEGMVELSEVDLLLVAHHGELEDKERRIQALETQVVELARESDKHSALIELIYDHGSADVRRAAAEILTLHDLDSQL